MRDRRDVLHFPRHVLRLAPLFQLFQRPDHLRLRVPALRHAPSPLLRAKSYSDLFGNRGAGHGDLRLRLTFTYHGCPDLPDQQEKEKCSRLVIRTRLDGQSSHAIEPNLHFRGRP